MSSDRPSKPEQRYSRFSRSYYDDILPLPPEEPTLTEITFRALNGRNEPGKSFHTEYEQRHIQERHSGWDQPPPPDPIPLWDEEADRTPPAPAASTPRRANPVPAEQPPLQPREPNPPPLEAEIRPLPREPRPATRPSMRDRLAERTTAGARSLLGRDKNKGSASLTRKPKRELLAKDRDVTAKSGALATALSLVRAKAVPVLVNGAAWLARNLQRREIRKHYNRVLIFSHLRVADRKLERLFYVSTRKSEIINPATERGVFYDGPIPEKAFDWVMSLMPDDLRQYAFVDIRAGRGRTTLLASKRKLNRIISYEYEPEIFDDLQMNVAQFPRSQMVCRNIDCYRGDVEGIRLPNQPCIIYFSSAWREPMLAGAMNYIRETYRQSPRRIFVILENTDPETALAGNSIFDAIEPPLAQRLKLKLFSPMDFKLYRSLM